MPKNQPLQLTEEDASMLVDELLAKQIEDASVARIRLAILSQTATQIELQYFLCEAFNAVGIELDKESRMAFHAKLF
jgi:hypothetical protein